MESDDWSVTVNTGGSLWLERPITWVALWTETEEGSPWQRCKRISGRRRSQTGWWTDRLCGRGLRSAEGHSAGNTYNTGGKSHGSNQREEGSDSCIHTSWCTECQTYSMCCLNIKWGCLIFQNIYFPFTVFVKLWSKCRFISSSENNAIPLKSAQCQSVNNTCFRMIMTLQRTQRKVHGTLRKNTVFTVTT